ncbi:hypothetical protein M3Y99_01454200 [Aphelenchoides fujianensis]|nr:hypothetical protein M3Y99_01454200 [Aphelenchoides fujianensis]
MAGLVDYDGSSSEEEEEMDASSTLDLPTSGGSKRVADLLDRLPPPSKTKPVAGQKRKLPIATPAPAEESSERRAWERELAEQVAQEKPKQAAKKRIFAFGSLTQRTKMDVDKKEEEEETAPSAATAAASAEHSGSASALLKMLPAPRGPSATKNGVSTARVSSLIPHAVSQRSVAPQTVVERPAAMPKLVDSDEEDDEAGGTDFFGFNSAKFEPPPTTASADMLPARSFAPQARIYSNAPGPARPTPADDAAAVDSADLFAPTSSRRKIDDERAQRMIYEKELAPWGATDNLAREAVLNIRDVSVDEQLGPNVQATLLRNLNNKAMAQVATGALPKVKKDPADRMAKQKHQITHLARVAVSREETLLEQWAANKEKKKASAKQYGF